MLRTDLIATITTKLAHDDLTILRGARFKRQPLRAAWFYFLVALNRYTPLQVPIRATTTWGHYLTAYETSAIGSVYFLGFYDSDLTLFLLKHYHATGDILDVGANVGVHTSLFSYLAPGEARVMAFEPTPSTYGVLVRNTAALRNVTTEAIALSDHTGTTTFFDYGIRHGVYNSAAAQPLAFLQDRGKEITVPTTTLDAYCAEHRLAPSLIKLDTEGTESAILAHATATLSAHRPIILLEVGGGEAWRANVEGCITTLRAHGYEFFVADKYGTLAAHQPQSTYQYQNLIAIHTSQTASYVSGT